MIPQDFIDADELRSHWVKVALIKWEMHHGFNLNLDIAMEYSIDQLVQHAQDTPFSLPEDYMDHVLKRHKEIDNIFIEHQWDDSEYDKESIDLDVYIGMNCQILVAHNETEGRVYANIESVLP